MRPRQTAPVWLAALVLAGGCASSGEISKVEAFKVRRVGGNVALLTPQWATKGGYFGLQDYKTADVYKCEGR